MDSIHSFYVDSPKIIAKIYIFTIEKCMLWLTGVNIHTSANNMSCKTKYKLVFWLSKMNKLSTLPCRICDGRKTPVETMEWWNRETAGSGFPKSKLGILRNQNGNLALLVSNWKFRKGNRSLGTVVESDKCKRPWPKPRSSTATSARDRAEPILCPTSPPDFE